MDSVNALHVFVQAAESQSFAAAGRALGISSSAVGKSIGRLEARARVPLFRRSSRSLRLTPEGERFLERCRRILDEIDAAEAELSEMAGGPRGLLRVSLPHANGLFDAMLADFQEAHPAVDLDLEITNRSVDLIREGFDVALRVGPVDDSTLTAQKLRPFRMVLVASPAYLAAHGKPRHPRDLADHARLQLRMSNSGRLRALSFLDPDLDEPTARRSPLTANNLGVIIHFALRGRGIAWVADFLVRGELARGELVAVLPEQVTESVPMRLVWPGKRVSPKLRAFVDHVTRSLRAR